MSQADPSLSVAERVDAACDEFEREWRAGRRPSVDDYVSAAPETDRDALRSALVAVEAELKTGRGAGDTSTDQESVCSGLPHGLTETVMRTPEQPGGHTSPEPQPVPAPGPTVQRPADQPVVPNRIGRFEVRAVLGSGAFGCVYRAFDASLDRDVAIKVPLPDSLRDPADRERFVTEAKAAAAIDHANICRIHEVGEHEGQPYIVMALVSGQSLAEVLRGRKEPLPEKLTATIVRKIALALDAAHKKGVVHRDLKPANIMWNKEEKQLVVMDFGLARRVESGDVRATQTGIVMGTPAYMSPEQARGAAKDVGPEGDIFSLGIIMYELLTGSRPFSGTAHEVIGQILLLDPEPPSERRAGVNPILEAVCLKALAKDPANRFASMKAFATAIDGYLRPNASALADTARATKTTPDGEDLPIAEPVPDEDGALSTNTRQLAEVFDAISEERKLAAAEREAAKAETAKAVEEAVRKHRTPRWLLGMVILLLATVGIAGYFLFLDKPTPPQTVKLVIEIKGVDFKDPTLAFKLDGTDKSGEELSKEIELTVDEHELQVFRDRVLLVRVKFKVVGGPEPKIEVKEKEQVTEPPPPKVDPKVTPVDPEAGFESLFNGKDLTGWGFGARPEAFAVDSDGNLTVTGDAKLGEQFWLLTKKEYTDYILRLEFQFADVPTDTNSGVAIRSGPNHHGTRGMQLEVQLRDTAKGALGTGAVIFGEGNAKKPLAPVDPLAAGTWHVLEIEVRWPKVKVTLNGKLVNDVDLTKFVALRGWAKTELERKQGHIGLQSWRSTTKFRNIRVKEFSPTPKPEPEAGFVSIFNGKDLTGWEAPSGAESFTVDKEGNLRVDEAPTHWLYTKKEYTDYILRAEFKFLAPWPTDCAVNVAPRCAINRDQPSANHKLRFLMHDLGKYPTGALFYTAQDKVPPKTPVDLSYTHLWHSLEVEMRGQRMILTINGKLANDVDFTKIDRTQLKKDDLWAVTELDRTKGHIAIQGFDHWTLFRNIRVKELTDDTITSTFDKDDEGWTVAGDARTKPNYHKTGGNPGGYLSAVDSASGDTWYWVAPAKFLGDRSASYGKTLSFDLAQSATTSPFENDDVILEGEKMTLVFKLPKHPDTKWTHYAVPLTASKGWKVKTTGKEATEEELKAVLKFLKRLWIRGEYQEGPDTGKLDNVSLE